jgi:hypothetical protein
MEEILFLRQENDDVFIGLEERATDFYPFISCGKCP